VYSTIRYGTYNHDSPGVLSYVRGGCALSTSMTRIAMLAGFFILLVGPPKLDRLKDRGETT